MLILALDTATTDLVTGLVDTEISAAYDAVVPGTRGHNEQLMPTIMALLDDHATTLADLDGIVVGHGPGPFTGLRVGMVTAQALGQALRIPVHGVSSLDAIATRHSADNLLVTTDARRREVYWASYQAGRRSAGPGVVRPENLEPPHPVDAVVVPQRLVVKLPSHLQDLETVELSPRAAGLVAVADLAQAPEPLSPEYLRRPDAVPPPEPKRSAALPPLKKEARP
ncbi:tRNA (adenosine(37)-N6)-threonylcarbamoyltransferase complex dimerization subunit type 1 TsaB [Corynebacterium yudongzhengii]|uniref:tRNA (Adenosine(37)-N6)-threonylcarbamoyltransferase complex dimerization subunit type 1 TsaB n=1 Tax=Corynebacterium yudongzhengii TaxID=2080740 RepID=A0A2U1T6W9_9CORY|nr:tRNA (adenosine(37)-N6)-threonylcarbamoyltransferase complex dimerization subunit type 1 TsaB [Corynebacterium yudongzhengii]AWB81304.1 tRNA (adenosine(37)-N6)-threonylcarbamoyltransferase complex dimerization subunit type 1 TsaB [Corynebacterium yudongzhengii]PWC01747.1 tRNA (adenosine(37)-N6)-threonylcarbamoyltransferase complex dimerization subunit type 1 TsaB [Corynebacterium yudongzhengii]